jgi:hypothetical protein
MTRMTFAPPPAVAAWQHRHARSGFEVVYIENAEPGLLVDGYVSAVEEGEAWAVEYRIAADQSWTARSARVRGRSLSGTRELLLEHDGAGAWTVNGSPAPELDGCHDVDLEASAFTNAFPVRRLGLAAGEQADAPAAYVRARDLVVERLEQRYMRLPDAGSRQRFHYVSPGFDFEAELVYDESGLIVDYPGIAVRAA